MIYDKNILTHSADLLSLPKDPLFPLQKDKNVSMAKRGGVEKFNSSVFPLATFVSQNIMSVMLY